MTEILKLKNISKSYNNVRSLNNVNITLKAGKIYGLIGLNGAGKTTLMKVIAGFIKPQSGTLELFGRSGEKEIARQRKRIGFLIDPPSGIHMNMTPYENMDFYRTLKGIPNKEYMEELLIMTGIKDYKKKKAGSLSMGMKQRLGIAISLLGNPEILILDEPVNGVDPAGIVEIRNMLKRLCEEKNISILISSHILGELDNLATDYIIIHEGQIKEEISGHDVKEKCRKYILLKTDEPERMSYIIENHLNTRNYIVMPDKSIRLYDYIDDRAAIARVFLDNKILVTNISCENGSLEEHFMSVIGRKNQYDYQGVEENYV